MQGYIYGMKFKSKCKLHSIARKVTELRKGSCKLCSRSNPVYTTINIEVMSLLILTFVRIKTLIKSYTVDSRYLDFGYLEQPLIPKRKSGPCLNLRSGNKILSIKKYCGNGEKLLPRSNFSPFPQYFKYI